MSKILILLLINLNLAIISFGQIEEQKIEINNIIKTACSDVPLNSKFILRIKNYELKLENSNGKNNKEINPNWVKSIEVIKNTKTLKEYGFKEESTLVIIELKSRKWKKLPRELREEFEVKKEN